MNDFSKLDQLAAIAIAGLIILTALGNALVMLIASILGLVVFALISWKNTNRGGVLAATVGCVIGIYLSIAWMSL